MTINNLAYKIRFSKRKVIVLLLGISMTSCIPSKNIRKENNSLPKSYGNIAVQDTVNSALINWNEFFQDEYLKTLIDSALVNNQELNIMMMQVDMSKNEDKSQASIQ